MTLGIVFGSLTPPEQLTTGAARAEQLGFGELWFSEDCFFSGGMSGVAQLLAATREVPVGLGLASVMTRHPAVLAMEIAGLARMHPGRFRAGLGLGNRHWLRQMGLDTDRPLTVVGETFDAVRALLAGREIDKPTYAHHFDQIRLDHPPVRSPQLWIGAVNRRALRLAGAKADGVLLSVLAGPAYIRWARAEIARGAAAAGREMPRITVFTLAAVDDDPALARDAVRDAVGFFVRAEAHTALVGQSALPAAHGAEIGDREVGEFAVAGTPAQVAAGLDELYAAGADSIGLWLFPGDSFAAVLERMARDVVPLIGTGTH
ncbi:LLM class flavin-dependent oxidoreductase [Nocardia yamanashiensis]|uniref:LLM class flavin-dependent oxidoreductase n=1 Tax=Nocardia yamanashiensis TaxID=209247 RepID=UPI001E447E3A|nr:LLM class flavin-dependent oxidoreductase [Nocardia yamanashiensis]UGT42779.1 LLM class flavin-dependent oxidoreductase [Nocardia yamanashiensis]